MDERADRDAAADQGDADARVRRYRTRRDEQLRRLLAAAGAGEPTVPGVPCERGGAHDENGGHRP